MKAIANILVALIALQHLWILVLEMFLWTRPAVVQQFSGVPLVMRAVGSCMEVSI